MERNLDPDIIVMNRSTADLLVHFARIGAAEAGDDIGEIERHIRKWNVQMMAESAQEKAARRAEDKRKRASLKMLLTYTGKAHVFYQVEKYVIGGFKVMSVSVNGKGYIRGCDTLTNKILDLPVDEVHPRLPDGYRLHQVGKYAGMWIHNDKRAF